MIENIQYTAIVIFITTIVVNLMINKKAEDLKNSYIYTWGVLWVGSLSVVIVTEIIEIWSR